MVFQSRDENINLLFLNTKSTWSILLSENSKHSHTSGDSTHPWGASALTINSLESLLLNITKCTLWKTYLTLKLLNSHKGVYYTVWTGDYVTTARHHLALQPVADSSVNQDKFNRRLCLILSVTDQYCELCGLQQRMVQTFKLWCGGFTVLVCACSHGQVSEKKGWVKGRVNKLMCQPFASIDCCH